MMLNVPHMLSHRKKWLWISIAFWTDNAKAVKILLENGANSNTLCERRGAKTSALEQAFSRSMLHSSYNMTFHNEMKSVCNLEYTKHWGWTMTL